MSDFAEGMRVQRELEEATQQHLLQFYEELSQEEKLDLENDLKNLEIDQLDHMFKGMIILAGILRLKCGLDLIFVNFFV